MWSECVWMRGIWIWMLSCKVLSDVNATGAPPFLSNQETKSIPVKLEEILKSYDATIPTITLGWIISRRLWVGNILVFVVFGKVGLCCRAVFQVVSLVCGRMVLADDFAILCLPHTKTWVLAGRDIPVVYELVGETSSLSLLPSDQVLAKSDNVGICHLSH